MFGLVRDRSSGEPLPAAFVVLHATKGERRLSLSADGAFEASELTPGAYVLEATFAGQRLTVDHIQVDAGLATPVDIAFDLGFDGDVAISYDALVANAPTRYRVGDGTASTGKLEVLLQTNEGRQRIAGATLYISSAQLASPIVLQTDAQGRAAAESLQSGLYDVSVYYTELRRGDLEQRRSGIAVTPGEATVITFPLDVPKGYNH